MSYSIPLDVLRPAFVLMGDRTRSEPDASTIAWYAKTWGEYRLQPAAILRAVDEIMRTWESGRWPGPDVIATRARQIMRDDEDYLAGQRDGANRLNDISDVAGAARWDGWRTEAREWALAHPDRMPDITRRVDADMKAYIDRFRHNPTARSTRPDVLDAMRKAMLVGAVLNAMATPKGKKPVRVGLTAMAA